MASELQEGGAVFVRDDHEGWVLGSVTRISGLGSSREVTVACPGKATMMLNDQELHSGKEVQLCDPLSLEGVGDMVKMDTLTVGSVLHNLRVRYGQDHIYTSVSSILVAVNPYKRINSLYDDAQKAIYTTMATNDNPAPHPFMLMELAYRGLLSDHKSQSILISGESGAGKTETTKYLLQYLSERSQASEEERLANEPGIAIRRPSTSIRKKGANGEQRAGSGLMTASGEREEQASVEECILKSNPIMEGFANAKTLRNNNSSRFGKYIQVTMHNSGVVAGGRVTTYLLEKIRVVQQLPGERNYHIFYQLVKGADPKWEELGLAGGPEAFAYLNGGGCTEIEGMDDQADFAQIRDCLESIGLEETAQMGLYRAVAAVLHLGNLEFDSIAIENQDNGSKVRGGINSPSLQTAALLMGVPPERLQEALTVKLLGNRNGQGSSQFMVNVPETPEEASASRNAVAKSLYNALFNFVVDKVNQSLNRAMMGRNKTGAQRFIGLLDIFGFEAFGTNSLEQLLINYANERLQQQFNFYVFKLQEAEFKVEGLDQVFKEKCKVDFLDNSDTLSVLEAKPMGVLSLLNEETTLKNGSSENLLKRYQQQLLGKSDVFTNPRVGKSRSSQGNEGRFCIRHFAGEVTYTIGSFVEKNKDEVPTTLKELVIASSDKFIAGLLADSPDDKEEAGHRRKVSTGTRKKGSSSFVSGKFQISLTELLQMIGDTSPHYIRCVKPNELQVPNTFTGAYVLQQLEWMGMISVVEVRQKGFSVRYPHQEFISKYSSLAGLGNPMEPNRKALTQRAVAKKGDAPVIDEQGLKARPQSVATAAELVKLGHMTEMDYMVGQSKIFLRSSTVRQLDAVREAAVKKQVLQSLKDSIATGNLEDMEVALELSTELRLKDPLVAQAKVEVQAIKQRRALAKVAAAKDSDNFEGLLAALQDAAAAGVPDSQLREARDYARTLQRRKEFMAGMNKMVTEARRGMKRQDYKVLGSLDRLLAEGEELGVPEADLADGRKVRKELKQLQEEEVLSRMRAELDKPKPSIVRMRELLEAATAMNIEYGQDVVAKCKALLNKSIVDEAAAEQVAEQEENEKEAQRVQAANARELPPDILDKNPDAKAPNQEFALVTALGTERITPDDIRQKAQAENAAGGPGRSETQTEYLQRIMAELNDPLPDAFNPMDDADVGLFDFIPMYKTNVPLKINTLLKMNNAQRLSVLHTGVQLLKITHGRIAKKKTAWKYVQLSRSKTQLYWMKENDKMKKGGQPGEGDVSLLELSTITHLTVGLESKTLLKEWEKAPYWSRLPSEWYYFSLHGPSRTYDFGALDPRMTMLWAVEINLIIESFNGTPPPPPDSAPYPGPMLKPVGALAKCQLHFQRTTQCNASVEEPCPLCPLLWPISRHIAKAASDLNINHPDYRHQWWIAIEYVELSLRAGYTSFISEDGKICYVKRTEAGEDGLEKDTVLKQLPSLELWREKVDLSEKVPLDFDTKSKMMELMSPAQLFLACYKGRIKSIRRFYKRVGNVDVLWDKKFNNAWSKAMADNDGEWALPSPLTTPLNYVCAYCEVMGISLAEDVVHALLDCGADPNQDDGDPTMWFTPLHSAITSQAATIVRMLVKRGADVNKLTGGGKSPLLTAITVPASSSTSARRGSSRSTGAGHSRGTSGTMSVSGASDGVNVDGEDDRMSIVATLLVAGADIDMTEPYKGDTALHVAARGGDVAGVGILLAGGASLLCTNGRGRTPMDAVITRLAEAKESQEAAGGDGAAAPTDLVANLETCMRLLEAKGME